MRQKGDCLSFRQPTVAATQLTALGYDPFDEGLFDEGGPTQTSTVTGLAGDSSSYTPVSAINRGELLPQGTPIGDFEIQSLLAQGGTGEIYLAYQPVIGKRVAIKVLSSHRSREPDAQARLLLEARTVNQVAHPNIVDIFAVGQLDNGRYYLVMELLEGPSLAELLRSCGPLPAAQLLPLFEQLCSALEAAHRCGFVHRDLKPDNVIVLDGPSPIVKVLDFGITMVCGAEERNTRVGFVIGTPEYMAPEQCRGAVADRRADVYALGVILYELLVGQRPFSGSPLSVLRRQIEDPPPPPSAHVAVPARLESLILSALSKSPEDRPQSAAAFIEAFRRALPATRYRPCQLPVLTLHPRAAATSDTQCLTVDTPAELDGSRPDPTRVDVPLPEPHELPEAQITTVDVLPRRGRRAYRPWLLAAVLFAMATVTAQLLSWIG